VEPLLRSVEVVVPLAAMKSRPKKRRQPINPATLHLIKQISRGLLLFGIIALLLTGLWHGTRLPIFTITTVTATGGITIDTAEVERKAAAVLEGSYLKFIPRRFSFFYPYEAIVAEVETVPRIKDVVVERVDRQAIEITFAEYVPDALWCVSKDSEECLFLDDSGYAFGEAPDLRGGSLMRYYSLQDSPAIGESPFYGEVYHTTQTFADTLALTGWYVKSVEVDSAQDAFYTLVGGGELKVSLKDEAERTLSFLATVRESEEFAHLLPGNFEYIDLRFGTKVFVNETALEVAEATSTATSVEATLE
jgi:cell division septal protein FtsQ